MRKKKSVYNMIASMSSYLIAMIFSFVTQSIFIKILGIEYLGVNGLFTNILTMLSVAELGIGTTIIFKLYKPIAENDERKIKEWMNFYKKCYNIIAIVILVLGIFLIPFLNILINDVPDIKESIIILYLIQLIDIVFSYCLTYKRSLLYADQKNYIINIFHIFYLICLNSSQIIILYITKNYIFYLMLKVLFRLLENILINIYVNRKYPYIKHNYETINEDEKKDLINRVKAIFVQKVSFVINKGIDNIIISIYLGVKAVGYYTNYFTIISAVASIIFQFMSSFSASIGNLLTENNHEKSYDIYKKINMINSILSGLCIVIVYSTIEKFIVVWIGEEYILSSYVLISFLIFLYSDSIRRTMTMFKDCKGICIEDKNMYIIMTVINLISSIFLCKIIGLSGVILGTAIAYLFLIFYSYPKFVFEPIFKISKVEYYKNTIIYIIYIFISCLCSRIVCNMMVFKSNLFQIVFNGMISLIICFILSLVFFSRKKEYKDIFLYVLKLFKKRG